MGKIRSCPEVSRLVGRRIRERRKARGLTMKDVALRCGTSKATVSNIECGNYGTSVGTIYALARAIGVRPSELLPDEPAGDPAPQAVAAFQLLAPAV